MMFRFLFLFCAVIRPIPRKNVVKMFFPKTTYFVIDAILYIVPLITEQYFSEKVIRRHSART